MAPVTTYLLNVRIRRRDDAPFPQNFYNKLPRGAFIKTMSFITVRPPICSGFILMLLFVLILRVYIYLVG